MFIISLLPVTVKTFSNTNGFEAVKTFIRKIYVSMEQRKVNHWRIYLRTLWGTTPECLNKTCLNTKDLSKNIARILYLFFV